MEGSYDKQSLSWTFRKYFQEKYSHLIMMDKESGLKREMQRKGKVD